MSDDNLAIDNTLDADGDSPAYEMDADESTNTPEPETPSEHPAPQDETPNQVPEDQVQQELDELIDRIKTISPEYNPPPFSPQRLLDVIRTNISQLSPETSLGILQRLQSSAVGDFFDLDTWKGVWYMLNYSLEYQKDLVKRRFSGDYETDEWGFDQEVFDAVKPFFDFLYYRYWRVQTSGLEHISEDGRALLVSNHSGQLPFDGSMLGLAIFNEHPSQRLVRTLVDRWFPTIPFISSLFVKVGQSLASEENGIRLLEQEQLVAVFPEGIKGVGKLYKDRYQLVRFGRGGFVRMALKTGAPMIPVSVVGAEETYISIAKSDFIARLIGFPFFPISITWPWFGLLGLIPIPTKWYIDIGEPIPTDVYGPNPENNARLESQLTDQMRNIIQNMIYTRLAQRKSVIFG